MGKRHERFGDELILYVRQSAWLTATPRRRDSKGNEEKLPRRIDQYRIDEIEPPLPPAVIEPFWSWLMEVGPIEAVGMGVGPIGWGTIDAWMRRTSALLGPADVRLLRRLSCEYHSELIAAEDWSRLAPWKREITEAERAAHDRQLRAAFGLVT